MRITLRYASALFLFLLLSSIFISVKAQRVVYAYDAAGNRISRSITLPSQAKAQPNEDAEEEPAEPFTDYVNQHQINIYPNPTKGYLAVEIAGLEQDTKASLQLYSLQGSLMGSHTVSAFRTDLDITSKPSGTYILKIVIDQESTSWKIIKE